MSNVIRDIGKIWERIFDNKAFLVGEVIFLLREFEQKRGDEEVDNLFHVIENITEIKDTETDRCKLISTQTLKKANEHLGEALNICHQIADLEETYKQATAVEEARNCRTAIWKNFMDGITTKYSEINCEIEAKEEELIQLYEDIEKKLLV